MDKKAKWSDKKWKSMNKDSAANIFQKKKVFSVCGFSGSGGIENGKLAEKYYGENVLGMESLLLPKEP